ncbi:MAG: MFS transporter [Deltaproteobacteria bacterium]
MADRNEDTETGLRGALATLRIPHLRPLVVSNFTHIVAIQTAMIAMQWLITGLTPSRTVIGLVGFVQFGAIALMSPLGGVIADRVSKRALLLAGRLVLASLSATMALLTFADTAHVWQGILVAFGTGLTAALLGPATMTYVFDVATRERATRAVALNATATGSAMILGRAIGGTIIAAVGTALTFTSASAFFLFATILLLLIPIRGEPKPNAHQRSLSQDLREGFAYVWSNPPLRFVLLACCMTIFNGAVFPMRPIYARYILGEGSSAYGAMAAAQGAGSLLAAFVLVALPIRRVGLVVVGSLWVYAICVFAYAFADSLPYLVGVEFALGVSGQVWNIAALSGLQMVVPEEMRGRVMGLVFTIAQLGFLGHLVIGILADQIGDRMALGIFGIIPTIVVGLVFIFGFPMIRELRLAPVGTSQPPA